VSSEGRDGERLRRAGFNEAAFRQVNERIREVSESFDRDPESMSILCECGDLACNAHVVVPRSEYERVRSEPRRFLLIPGHAQPELETIVERHGDYEIVEKHEGDAARIAEETDPRANA
jgi:hypothetical protein